MKHVHWTCDATGCGQRMDEPPVTATLTMDANGWMDRTATFELCGSCLNKLYNRMWPDHWPENGRSP